MHRLALATGWVDPDAMLASITLEQATNWLRYYNQEPFGELRADYRAAIIAHTQAATATKKPPKFESFVLAERLKPKKAMTDKELELAFRNLAAQGAGKWQPKT